MNTLLALIEKRSCALTLIDAASARTPKLVPVWSSVHL